MCACAKSESASSLKERETDRETERERRVGRREVVGWGVLADGAWDGRGADMRLAITPGPTVHWLFRSHDLPSKLSAIASRLCDRRSRTVKHVYVSPLLRNFAVVSAVLLVPNFIL